MAFKKFRFASSRESEGDATPIEPASELCDRFDGMRVNRDGLIAMLLRVPRRQIKIPGWRVCSCVRPTSPVRADVDSSLGSHLLGNNGRQSGVASRMAVWRSSASDLHCTGL
jgi:hypothetical protein